MKSTVACTLALSTIAFSCAAAARSATGAPRGADVQSHPFSVRDMLAMERISDHRVSPDGQWVSFTVRTTDMEANRGRTDVWIAACDGSVARRLTKHEAADGGARWMPDGHSLVFLSTRGGSSQVWMIPVDGGEPRQMTDFPVDVTNVVPFPDGQRLLLTMEVYPETTALAQTHERDAAAEQNPVKARLYDELLFRHWDSWEDGKRSHVFVWNLGGGEPVDLMRGLDVDAPPQPFGGAEELAISPDGATVVYSAKNMGREAAWSTNVDLWAVPSDGSRAPRCLTPDNPAQDGQPRFSPDGTRLAWLAMARAGYESDRQRIKVMDWKSGTQRALTEAWDRSPSDLDWTHDGRALLCSADHVGNHSLFRVDAASGDATLLVQQGTNAGGQSAGERVLFAHDDLRGPVELVTIAADGGDERAVTRLNEERVAAARTGDYEPFQFSGANGDEVHGFVLKPADFEAGRKYPVALLIHGGPQGSFGDHFHYRWNPQAYAGAGYAAVFIDFHGSTGYGQAFCDAIRGDWGGAPYQDLMKGLDFALEHYDFLDGERVAALGASYGGYMVNWIAGQTDRFQCLVSHDGNLDERAAYFMTEELWFPEWDHGGTPWNHVEGYARHNPADHVKNWKTPILVIHGGLDYRVVDTQGMATFTAAQRMGVPSRLLYFPDENHWVLKPRNSVLWHETVLAWLDRWLDAPTEG